MSEEHVRNDDSVPTSNSGACVSERTEVCSLAGNASGELKAVRFPANGQNLPPVEAENAPRSLRPRHVAVTGGPRASSRRNLGVPPEMCGSTTGHLAEAKTACSLPRGSKRRRR